MKISPETIYARPGGVHVVHEFQAAFDDAMRLPDETEHKPCLVAYLKALRDAAIMAYGGVKAC